MKISLLIQREPFGRIFEDTISRFLTDLYGQEYNVSWECATTASDNTNQIWLCNYYLNAIFATTAETYIFEPIVREFGRSVQWWKRPMQYIYVQVALKTFFRQYFASSAILISPPIPKAEYYLFVGGNHKIRILDALNQVTYGILKYGFPQKMIVQEVKTREIARQLNIPVPNLLYVAENQSWFKEAYIVGTPLNRLSNINVKKQFTHRAFNEIKKLWDATVLKINIVDYVDELIQELHLILDSLELLTDTLREDFQSIIHKLYSYIVAVAKNSNMFTAISHGDFQPANILVDNNQIWIIDWEYSERRSYDYDTLVFMLNSRSPDGLAHRLNYWTHNGNVELTDQIPSKNINLTRNIRGAIFLLEELHLYLDENSNSQFTQLGTGLLNIRDEILEWFTYVEEG